MVWNSADIAYIDYTSNFVENSRVFNWELRVYILLYNIYSTGLGIATNYLTCQAAALSMLSEQRYLTTLHHHS